jgi:hypothetical protein
MRKLSIAALCALAGCASITQGTSQMLTFNIDPKEARCTLNRVDDGVLGHVSASSNLITVTKDKDDIIVVCKAAGYKDSTTKIASAASGGGVASVFLIDFGITDLATGAFWKYPETHSIVLERETGSVLPASASTAPAAPVAMPTSTTSSPTGSAVEVKGTDGTSPR